MPPSRIPNLLSLLRMVTAPLLVPAATAGRTTFLVLLTLLLVSDGLDGYLARRLGALSARGAMLDSIADHVMSICGFAGIWYLWPQPLRQEAPWVVLIVSAYTLPVIYSLLRFGRLLAYHTFLSRIAGFVAAAAVLPLLLGWSGVPLRVAAVLELLVASEYVTISILLPDHRGPVRSLLAARRMAGSSDVSVDPAENPS
jgi:phosphatidylglycerophosphate synthase